MTAQGRGAVTSAVRSLTAARPRWNWRRHGPLLFIVPALLYMALFFAYPLVFGVIMSLENFNFAAVIRGSGPFVGLANYLTVLSNPVTVQAIVDTVIFTVLSLALQFCIGFAIAVLLSNRYLLSGFFRSLLLIPWLLPLLASGTVWELIFQGNGLLNTVLLAVHVIHSPIYWLVTPFTAFASVVAVNIWAGIPFNAMLLYEQDDEVEAR